MHSVAEVTAQLTAAPTAGATAGVTAALTTAQQCIPQPCNCSLSTRQNVHVEDHALHQARAVLCPVEGQTGGCCHEGIERRLLCNSHAGEDGRWLMGGAASPQLLPCRHPYAAFQYCAVVLLLALQPAARRTQ